MIERKKNPFSKNGNKSNYNLSTYMQNNHKNLNRNNLDRRSCINSKINFRPQTPNIERDTQSLGNFKNILPKNLITEPNYDFSKDNEQNQENIQNEQNNNYELEDIIINNDYNITALNYDFNSENNPDLKFENNNEDMNNIYLQDIESNQINNNLGEIDIHYKEMMTENLIDKKINDKFDKVINIMEEKFKVLNNEIKNCYQQINQLRIENSKNFLNNQNSIKKNDEILNNQIKYENKIKFYRENEKKYNKKIQELNEEITKLKKEKINNEINQIIPQENNYLINNDYNNCENIEYNNENHNNNIINYEPNFQYINFNQNLTSPTITKLINIRKGSFINAIIQCLIHTDSLTNYFQTHNIKNKNYFSFYYKELISNMCNKNTKYYDPNKFIKFFNNYHEKIKSKMNIKVIYNYVFSILNILHFELKEKKEIIINIKNKVELNAFKRDYGDDFSIIKDLFYGVIEDLKFCPSQKIIMNNNNYFDFKFKQFSFIHLESESGIEEINLIDLLNKNRRNKLKSVYEPCGLCRGNCHVNYLTKYIICPKILIIMLSYPKNYTRIIYEEKLDLTNLTKLQNENIIQQTVYDLYGIISRDKINKTFYARIKLKENNSWYRFSDDNIEPINNYKDKQLDNEISLILFYNKINKV